MHLYYAHLIYFLLGWACGGFSVWEIMTSRQCTPEKPCRCCAEAAIDEIEHYANET